MSSYEPQPSTRNEPQEQRSLLVSSYEPQYSTRAQPNQALHFQSYWCLTDMDKQLLTSPSTIEQSACTPPKKVKKKGRIHIDKRTTSYGRRRMQFMTSKAQIKETCSTMCYIKNCLQARLGVTKLTLVKIWYFGLNREEQDYYLNAAITQLKSDQIESYSKSMQICKSVFKIIHGLENARLVLVQKRLRCFKNPRLIEPLGQM